MREKQQGFLARNSTAIASVASLAVALLSLFVATITSFETIKSHDVDQRYKELAIRPRLRTGFDTGSLSFWLSNVGLGPAVIRRLVFFDGKTCRDSQKEPDRLVVRKALEQSIRDYFYIGMPIPMTKSDKVIVFPLSTVTAPTINTTIEAGKSIDMISFDKDEMKKYWSALNNIDEKHAINLHEGFYDKATRVPIGLEYCSMSGLFCGATGNFHPNCDGPNFKIEE